MNTPRAKAAAQLSATQILRHLVGTVDLGPHRSNSFVVYKGKESA